MLKSAIKTWSEEINDSYWALVANHDEMKRELQEFQSHQQRITRLQSTIVWMTAQWWRNSWKRKYVSWYYLSKVVRHCIPVDMNDISHRQDMLISTATAHSKVVAFAAEVWSVPHGNTLNLKGQKWFEFSNQVQQSAVRERQLSSASSETSSTVWRFDVETYGQN